MNAPARIEATAAVQPWERYIPTVDALLPGCPLHEKRERARLMLLRDLAAAAQPNVSWEAAQALITVEQIANTHALTRMDVMMLSATRAAVARIYRSAMFLEEVFGRGDG